MQDELGRSMQELLVVDTNLVNLAEIAQFNTPVIFEVWNRENQDGATSLHIDARPLARLIGDAAHGRRVYELQTITRPGDILHYLWVSLPVVQNGLAKHICQCIDAESLHSRRHVQKPDSFELGFLSFDTHILSGIGPSNPYAEPWKMFKAKSDWRSHLTTLFMLVRKAQMRLKFSADGFIRDELQQATAGRHYLSFDSELKRFGELLIESPGEDISDEVREKLLTLAEQDDVRSVSLPFKDYALWRGLIGIQRRKATASGLDPQKTFALIGPEGGIPWVNDGDYRADLAWGGFVYIPRDNGVQPADIYARPDLSGVDQDSANTCLNLSQAVFDPWYRERHSFCKYFLTQSKDDVVIRGTTKTKLGNWVLYSSVDAQLN